MVVRGKTRRDANCLRKKAGIPSRLLNIDLSFRRTKRASLGVMCKSELRGV